ncbi:helix-turn-helix domain-containing protein [Candidatus Woesebacteria bacterium]|nr:helix-turn-helix domain-containing protein [Candidatus Woesebacteria bacterium]MCD8506742.1 helix-turn-helix domain-containing protein [Candidatus Woesebacteria bacterium]MCD8527650.1 helix-turn-helix domain-containing protein [Candidatus Woesebacteria bacterium]MCD8546380.1 helix-turn-helix domain-containing protein [Candidatus Woesebacteria bacterium]
MKIKNIQKVEERRKEKQAFAKKLGDHLRKVRNKVGKSQEDLSMDAGYYRTYVGKIEQGHYSPSAHTIWRLAHTLGMSLDEFFEGFK